ncbi:MAG: hypothetical protein HYV02_03790 [Deltaproteobacteria bacterium]|nr:hypothetical protein [Deltaproteobacteria bacterium]
MSPWDPTEVERMLGDSRARLRDFTRAHHPTLQHLRYIGNTVLLTAALAPVWKAAGRTDQTTAERQAHVETYLRTEAGERLRPIMQDQVEIVTTHFPDERWGNTSLDARNVFTPEGDIRDWTLFATWMNDAMRNLDAAEDAKLRAAEQRLFSSRVL